MDKKLLTIATLSSIAYVSWEVYKNKDYIYKRFKDWQYTTH